MIGKIAAFIALDARNNGKRNHYRPAKERELIKQE